MRDPLTLMARLLGSPRQFEAVAALRIVECAHPHHAALGTAARAAREPIRLGHDAELRFSTAQVTSYEPGRDNRPARLALDFGLLGPDGPMPLHLTEHVRARARHRDDRTFERFLDLFHHRMSSLRYRAWAVSQPVVGLDRPGEDRFATYVDRLCGLAHGHAGPNAAIDDEALRGAAGSLGDRRRHAVGLAAVLARTLGAPVRIEPFVGQWLCVPDSEGVRLGASHRRTLGEGYVLGRRAWDRQHKFRIVVGPLGAAKSERLQPDGLQFRRMVAWVRRYVGPMLDFEFVYRLKRDAARPMRLGAARLARHTWLGDPVRCQDGQALLRFSGRGTRVTTFD